GQCSAGTLPVAWVDEGPGPPRCPPPCATVTTMDKMSNEYNKVNMESRFDKQQQCLDYIGDNEESSPAQICKKSSRDIETKLRALRLRHCCERSAISALHSQALEDVLNGEWWKEKRVSGVGLKVRKGGWLAMKYPKRSLFSERKVEERSPAFVKKIQDLHNCAQVQLVQTIAFVTNTPPWDFLLPR
uniref:Uncharacterized protein n=1 Tax=Phlebotomus papatasi TaxID=29031 RepID=A0A1B0DH44_PHLPP